MAKRTAASLYASIKYDDIDLIQAEQTVTIPVGLELKKLFKVPLVADVHNLQSLELVSAGLIKENSRAYKQIDAWTGYLLSQVDLVVAVSEEMKSYLVSHYALPGSKIVVVPPGGRLGVPEYVKTDPPKVVYAGLAAYREHIDLFIRSIPYVHRERPDAQFYISKKGEDHEKLVALAREVGAHVTSTWYEDESEFLSFLGSSSIGILPSSNDLARKIGTPLKLMEYLAFGLPIVANDVGAWSSMISEEEVGLVTEDDPQAFASAILKLLGDQELAAKCAQKGRELIRTKYNWDNGAKKLLDAYKALLD